MAKVAPRPPNLEPTWFQDLPTWSQDGPKTSNLEPPHPPKTLKNQWFSLIFRCFCYVGQVAYKKQFDVYLGAKMPSKPPNLEPRGPQLGTERSTNHPLEPSTNLKNQCFFNAFALDPQLGAKMAPRPSDLEPRWSQDLQLGAKMAPRPPTWSP